MARGGWTEETRVSKIVCIEENEGWGVGANPASKPFSAESVKRGMKEDAAVQATYRGTRAGRFRAS
jgi:hypothetical protein